MVALPGAHSPQLMYNPSPWLKNKICRGGVGAAALPPTPLARCSEGRQLRQAEAAVDAGVVRARVGQAQGL